MQGTTFSRTFNSDAALKDSAMSENCVRQYSLRSMAWDGFPFEYYQYYKPLAENGALGGTEIIPCSNGEIRKASKWNVDKRMTFNKFIIVEAEVNSNVKSVTRQYSATLKDSVDMATIAYRTVTSDNDFFGRVWDSGFAEVAPEGSVNYDITFYLKNVLSNIGYDIWLVTAPALANDSNATSAERMPTKFRCIISGAGNSFKSENFTTTSDQMDYFLVAEDFKFNTCTYGLSSLDLHPTMKVETQVSSKENNKTLTRTMRIDCILLVPHGALQLVDALPNSADPSAAGKPGLLLYPHGQYDDRAYKGWYMLR
jgi:hypothetical protein